MSVCTTRPALTFLSLKCKNDIQAFSVVLTDPERQKEAFQDRAELLTQANKSFTYKAKMATALPFCPLFSFIFCCHAWLLPSGISVAVRRELTSVQYSSIRFVLDSFLWCVYLFQCVSRAGGAAQASHCSVWGGQKKERQSHKEGAFKKDVGLPGWPAISTGFHS